MVIKDLSIILADLQEVEASVSDLLIINLSDYSFHLVDLECILAERLTVKRIDLLVVDEVLKSVHLEVIACNLVVVGKPTDPQKPFGWVV